MLNDSMTTAEGAWPVGAEVKPEIVPLFDPRKAKRLSELWPTMKRKGPIGLPKCGPLLDPHPVMMESRQIRIREPKVRIAFIASPYAQVGYYEQELRLYLLKNAPGIDSCRNINYSWQFALWQNSM
jgi:hypothetical protein